MSGEPESGAKCRSETAHDENAAAIARALDLWISRLGRQFGPLSRPQRRALRAVAELCQHRGMVRASDLAEFLGLTSAGATRMLNRLETDGYIGRFRDPDADQREVYAALTEAGQAALSAANDIYFERVEHDLERLSGTERETLARLLVKLTASG